MERVVKPELLDLLLPDDPRALGSRRDLQRLNRWMANAQTVTRVLQQMLGGFAPQRLVELGAGDGRFLLSVAARLRSAGAGTHATLVDRHHLVSRQTLSDFKALHWELDVLVTDIFEWLKQSNPEPFDLILTNLSLHHFPENQLATLLSAVAKRSRAFVAVEPRRSGLALLFSRLVGLIGCNSVTRCDAPTSVRAGFTENDLSRFWPRGQEWRLEERRAGLFSHLFVAQKTGR